MQCEWFISSLSKILLSSSNLEKLVSIDDLHYLLHLRMTTDKQEYLRTTLNDTLGAVSYIKPIVDEYNREGVWNHTFIFKLKDYFNTTTPTELFTSYFVRCKEDLPKTLEPYNIGNPVSASEAARQTAR